AYAVYRALAVASGALQPDHRPDLTHTAPVEAIGPYPSWAQPETMVSLDPFGAVVCQVFADFYVHGYDIRPTIAVTRAHINMPELQEAVAKGRLAVDGTILLAGGDIVVTKAAIEPVWYLPGVARRFDVDESTLRHTLFEQTGGMFPELVTRPDARPGVIVPSPTSRARNALPACRICAFRNSCQTSCTGWGSPRSTTSCR